jgi:hypothetical protein
VLEQSHNQEDFVSIISIDEPITARPASLETSPNSGDFFSDPDAVAAFMCLPAYEFEPPADPADRKVYHELFDPRDKDPDKLFTGTTAPYAVGVLAC